MQRVAVTSTAQKRRHLQPHIPVLQLEVGNKAAHLHGYSRHCRECDLPSQADSHLALRSSLWRARRGAAGVCVLRSGSSSLGSVPVLVGSRELRGPRHDSRRHSEPGASSPGGNNGAEAGAPEAGRGGGLGSAAGGPQIVRPPLSSTRRRRRLRLLVARVPSPLRGLRRALTAARLWCASGT